MNKLYKKSELSFAIVWIIIYCVLMSVGDNLSESFGITDAFTLPISAVLSLILFVFIKKNKLMKKYGICKSEITASEMLYYIPLVALFAANLFGGITLNLSLLETVLYILTMLCVGFLEEVIFRGLLFNAMLKDGEKSAIIVSSVTFGIGHIIRLFNGSGAELIPNLIQVIYAIAAGFMFVMIYHKAKTLIPCIVTHSLFNALSVFADETSLTVKQRIISCIYMVSISAFYGVYIAAKNKKK